MNSGYSAVSLLVFLSLVILVLALIRNLTLWYFRIDRIVQLLESIDAKLSVRKPPEP